MPAEAPANPPTTPPAPPEVDLEVVSNPFIEGGDVSDVDQEAGERLFAESMGQAPKEPVLEPGAAPSTKAPEGDDLKGEEELAASPEGGQKPDDQKPADDPLKGMFSRKPAAKKVENKGLRTQNKDLAQQRDAFQSQLEQKEVELQQLRDDRDRIDGERKTYQQSLSKRFEVGKYDPNQDPEIQKLDNKIDLALKKAQINLGPDHGNIFSKHSAKLAEHYNTAMSTGNVDDYYAFLEKNFPGNVQGASQEISRISDLLAERGELQTANQTDFFKTSIGGWEDRKKATVESVQAIGEMTLESAQDQMTADDTSANAVISLVAQNFPAFKKVLTDIRSRTATFISGVRPFDIRDNKWEPYLDPTDPTRLSEDGERMRQAEIYNHQRSQELLPMRLAQGEASSQLLPIMAKRIAELEARLGDEQGIEIDPDLGGSADGDGTAPKGFSMTAEDLDDHTKLQNPYLDDALK